MKKFTIYSRTDNFSINAAQRIREELEANAWSNDDVNPEFVIVIGGDGKVLRAIHRYLNQLDKTKFVALNTGTLGFLTDYNSKDVNLLIDDLLTKDYQEEKCHLLEVNYFYDDKKEQHFCVNELRVEHRFRTLEINVAIDNQDFEKTFGNGLCICSPLGSTAYNRSLGGPLVERTIKAITISEIAPINTRNIRTLLNPLILDETHKISLESQYFESAYIGIDYYSIKKPKAGKIEVQLSPKCVNLIHFRENSFLKKIKEKFLD